MKVVGVDAVDSEARIQKIKKKLWKNENNFNEWLSRIFFGDEFQKKNFYFFLMEINFQL